MSRVITTLYSNKTLTKTYYTDKPTEPYPLVAEFTSIKVAYETIEELAGIIKLTAENGGCLLKGHLLKDLVSESRAGHNNPSEPTDFLVLDYDSDAGFENIEELLEEIDPRLLSTDYLFQHSASSGITGSSGLRGHIFVLLEEPVAPTMLKIWVQKVNLTSEKFKQRAKLSRHAMGITYALDITINQNDKLIYVAPPRCIGFDDPIEERFIVVKKEHRTYKFDASVSTEFNKTAERNLLRKLQNAAGVTVANPKYKTVGDYEILTNPSACVVTGTKDCGKFMRVNLNGGDSYAYWYYKEAPDVLHNFKGEPSVYLRDVAPGYYASILRRQSTEQLVPFVFRDLALNRFYNAEYDPKTDRVKMVYPTDRTNLSDFMLQRGAIPPSIIPDWDVYFDPSQSSSPVDFVNRRMNLFSPTPYLCSTNTGEFPTIEKILRHICVDDKTYQHFLRWLAHIVQFRTKTQTAWIFQGTYGTGKGTMFHEILTPIFGANHCHIIGQEAAEGQYNDFMRQNIICYLDEADATSANNTEKLMAKFRTFITDKTVPIRRMRTDPFQAPSYSNFILATNQMLPAIITQDDRRYNIAPRQETRLFIPDEDFDQIESQLMNFVGHLKSIKINKGDSRILLQSEARQAMIQLGKSGADLFFDALNDGNLNYFAEFLQETPPIPDNGYTMFANIITKWLVTAGQPIDILNTDMVLVYKYIGGKDKANMTEKKFGHLAGRHKLKASQRKVAGISRTFYRIQFHYQDYSEWLNRAIKKTQLRVVRD